MMMRAEVADYQFNDEVANENEPQSSLDTRVATEQASFAPRIPRKEFGLRRIPPSVLKSWPGICH
ncbi:hypothetical protein [uncultured Brevundimonas sp.]|uniref:hypothetical protein n=1 Tax=uncultured Brevundimonas sp. TaxID=213418 RepID=UPI00260288C1|nr:hypothetical protein [uncultured Brevundimonas sp.]